MTPPPKFLSKPIITRREWWFVWFLAVIAVAISLLPMVIGAQRTPPGSKFLYTNIPDVNDSQVYYAFIDQNAHGHLFYRNLFTSEQHRPVLFDPLWTLLGGAVALTHQQPAVIFLEGCAAFSVLLLFLIYYFLSHFFAPIRWRAFCFLLIIFGGGFGGLALLWKYPGDKLISLFTQSGVLHNMPIDLTQPAGFTWMTLSHAPHYILSQIIFLFVWLALWRGRWIGWASVATGMLGFIHPYDLVLLFAVPIVHTIFLITRNNVTPEQVRRYARSFGWLLIGTAPSVAYYAWALLSEPVIRQWFKQNILLAPTPLAFVLGYGCVLWLAIDGIRRVWRGRDQEWLLAASWATASIALLYLPLVSFEAKMMGGINIPIAMLATVSLSGIIAWLKQNKRRSWMMGGAAIVATILTFSTVVLWTGRVITSERTEPNYHYASNDLISSLAWIKENTDESAIVLGDMPTGNLVPQFAGRQTYLGHNVQTINFEEKLALVRRWFYGTSDEGDRKYKFLKDQRIRYVVWGPNERRLGPFNPKTMPGLQKVYERGEVDVYDVR